MAKRDKIGVQDNLRSELSLSQRIAAADNDKGPSFHDFTVTVRELFVVIWNWFFSKLFVLKSTRSVEINGFNRPRSGGLYQNEGRMKSELGVAVYRKDIRNSAATHRD